MVHICDYLQQAAAKTPQKVITVSDGRRKTAQQLSSRVAALAIALRRDLDLASGQVVLLAIDSSDTFLEGLLAVTAAGAIAAPLNLRWSLSEAARAVNLCQARIVLVDAPNQKFLDLATQPGCQSLQHTIVMKDEEAAEPGRLSVHKPVISCYLGVALTIRYAPSDAAIICFTSGTTGAPKAATISHSALHFQALQKNAVVGYSAEDIYLHAAPLFHIGGLSSALAVLLAGGTHIFMQSWVPSIALDIIQESKVTSFIGVPATITDLTALAGPSPASNASGSPTQYKSIARPHPMDMASGNTRHYKSIKKVLVGAGGMSHQLQLKMQATFPNATVHSAYGMTEACSSMTFKFLFSPQQRLPITQPVSVLPEAQPPRVNVGAAPPGIEMAVLAAPRQGGASTHFEALEIMETGQGELLTRGPHVMTSYWDQPTETQAAFLPGEWLKTGDLGAIDDQRQVWLTGRIKDTIRTGGETVHAVEVENVLTQAAAIQAAAVFALPHERFGEQVAAVIQLGSRTTWTGTVLGPVIVVGPDVPLTPLFVRRFCQQSSLSAFKVPKVMVAQYAPLPRNASGKIVKSELKLAVLAALRRPQVTKDARSGIFSRL